MSRRRLLVTAVLASIFTVQSVAVAAPRGRVGLGRAFKKGEVVKLDGGESVSAERYNQELNQLQEALETDGVSMRKEDHKPPPKALPLYKGAEAEKERDKATLSAHKTNLANIEKGGFAALMKKRLGAGSKAGAIRGATAAPRPRPGLKGDPGPLDDDALDVTYNETLGSAKRAAIYVGMVLKDTGEKDAVGCDATADGGVHLFEKKLPLVKLAASGSIKGGAINGSVDLFLLGKSVDGYPKRGQANAAVSKSIAPPPATAKYGWGPIGIEVKGSIAGELRLNAANSQQGKNASQLGRCSLTAEPTIRASAKATAQVNAIAYKVGVEGQIVLLDIKTPVASSVMVKSDLSSMTEDFRASVVASFLDGDVALFVKTRVPQDGERFYDLDWDQVYRKMLMDWDGLRIETKLANFSGKQTKL